MRRLVFWWLLGWSPASSLVQGFGGCSLLVYSQPLTGVGVAASLIVYSQPLTGVAVAALLITCRSLFIDWVAALFIACSQPLTGVLHARSLLHELVACEQPRTRAALYWGLLGG